MVNAPLVVYSSIALSSPASLTRFRIWAVSMAGISVALHLGAALLIARWLRARGQAHKAAPARDIIVGFRGQIILTLCATVAMWWLASRAASALGRHTPSSADLAPLSTYGWVATIVVIAFGSLAAVMVAIRQTAVPPARLQRRRS